MILNALQQYLEVIFLLMWSESGTAIEMAYRAVDVGETLVQLAIASQLTHNR